jgi:hypothetical protein
MMPAGIQPPLRRRPSARMRAPGEGLVQNDDGGPELAGPPSTEESRMNKMHFLLVLRVLRWRMKIRLCLTRA